MYEDKTVMREVKINITCSNNVRKVYGKKMNKKIVMYKNVRC